MKKTDMDILLGFSFNWTSLVVGVVFNVTPFADCLAIHFLSTMALWIEWNHRHAAEWIKIDGNEEQAMSPCMTYLMA